MSKGKKNLYQCHDCHGEIVTLDLVDGTTPFMLACLVTPGCKGMMTSSFYQIDQSLPFQYEWFMPDSPDGYDEWTRDHIQKGGLVIRRRLIDLEHLEDRRLKNAIEITRDREKISIAVLQREVKVRYTMASMLMIQLIKLGVIFPTRDKAGKHFVVQEIDWKKRST